MSVTIKEAIDEFTSLSNYITASHECGLFTTDGDNKVRDSCELAIAALRAQQKRDDSRLLTLDELREMDGEPVWIVWPDGRIKSRWWIVGDAHWLEMFSEDLSVSGMRDYGVTWIAYRHKPQSEWIAVAEQAPPQDERVILTDGDNMFFGYGGITALLPSITHWRPRPELPKKVEKGETK